MKMTSLLRGIFLAFVMLPGLGVYADVIVSKDTVSGIVVDKNKNPLPGAKVEIDDRSQSAFTDIDGRFRIITEAGAKKVRVTYPKLKEVKKKIKPDMTVQIGRSWKQIPEKYQWFVGANLGVGYFTADEYDRQLINNYNKELYETEYWGPNFSIMGGRVKQVGWYTKYNCTSFGEGGSVYSFILGGLVRLGCPLHLYLGGGISHSRFNPDDHIENRYSYWNDYEALPGRPHFNRNAVHVDMGLLFRIKHLGINWSMSLGGNNDYLNETVMNLGVLYFFNND